MLQRFHARHRHRRLVGLAIGALFCGVLTVATTAVPAYAAGGDGRAYVTNFGNGTVSVIDTATQTVVDTIPVGNGPQGIAVNAAGTTAYVANQNSNTVSVIDLSTDTVSATIDINPNIPSFKPNFDALSPSGGTLFVTNLNQTTNTLILAISTATNTPTQVVGTGSNDLAYGLAVASSKVYVPGAVSNSLITATSAGVSVAVGTTPIDVALSPNGGTAYVTNNQSSNLSVVDTASNTVTGTIATASLPFGIALNPAGTTGYVTTGGTSSLAVINTSTQAVTATVPLGGGGYFPAVDPTGSFVYVPVLNGTVAVVSTSSNTVANTITGFSSPRDVAFGPAAQADIAVGVSAQALHLLSPAIQFTLAADNLGPDPVTAATLTASIPPGVTATSLSPGCSQTGASIACTFGNISSGSTAHASFNLPVALLEIGTVTVDATRTSSAPADPNPANDNASASCTVVSVVLAIC